MFALVLKVVNVLMGMQGGHEASWWRIKDERETGPVLDFDVITIELMYAYIIVHRW